MKAKQQDTGLRTVLLDSARRRLHIAERFERLGATGEVGAARDHIRALERGDPVTVSPWDLSSALWDTGAKDASREVYDSTTYYTVHEDGSFTAVI